MTSGGLSYSVPVGSTLDTCFRQFTEAFGVFHKLPRSSSTWAVVCPGQFCSSRYATCCVPFDCRLDGAAFVVDNGGMILAGFAGGDVRCVPFCCFQAQEARPLGRYGPEGQLCSCTDFLGDDDFFHIRRAAWYVCGICIASVTEAFLTFFHIFSMGRWTWTLRSASACG